MLKRNAGQNIVTYCLGVCEQENRILLIGKVMVTLTEIEDTGAEAGIVDSICLDTVIFEEHILRNFDIFPPEFSAWSQI